MKELDQFTVEQLWKYANPEDLTFTPSHDQVAALAMIALAAKRAAPSYWITYYPNPDPNEFDDREHSHSGAKSCAVRIAAEIGGFVVPVYHGISPLNSPETPDGWIACSERMPVKYEEVVLWCPETKEQFIGFYDGREYVYAQGPDGVQIVLILSDISHWQPCAAAPKPVK